MNKLLKLKITLLTCTSLCLSLCGTSVFAAELGQFDTTNASTFNSYNTGINEIRLQALRETATTLGAQSGLAWKAKSINATLKAQSQHLNQVFNFNALLLKHNVLPPVLAQGDHAVNQNDPDTMRIADKIYRIVHPAELVTTPPNWRSYLMLNYKAPGSPDHTLLPKTKMEATVWNACVHTGWAQGVTQANSIFSANLNRLKRDYKGMILYKKLVLNDMISSPHVSKADLGVTGNSQEMRIDDQVIRITMHSKLQLDTHKWNPVLHN